MIYDNEIIDRIQQELESLKLVNLEELNYDDKYLDFLE